MELGAGQCGSVMYELVKGLTCSVTWRLRRSTDAMCKMKSENSYLSTVRLLLTSEAALPEPVVSSWTNMPAQQLGSSEHVRQIVNQIPYGPAKHQLCGLRRRAAYLQ